MQWFQLDVSFLLFFWTCKYLLFYLFSAIYPKNPAVLPFGSVRVLGQLTPRWHWKFKKYREEIDAEWPPNYAKRSTPQVLCWARKFVKQRTLIMHLFSVWHSSPRYSNSDPKWLKTKLNEERRNGYQNEVDRRIDPLKGKAGQFEFPVNFDLLQHQRCSADTYVACLDPTDCVNVSVTNYIYILTSCLSPF